MSNYEKMYALMCAATSQAIDKFPVNAENLEGILELKMALHKAEDMYCDFIEC